MADFILIDGDQVQFQVTFGLASVQMQPGQLKASGPATFKGKKLCVEGDEQSVAVANCLYTAGQYSIPGTGTLRIATLASDQKAQKTKTGGKVVLLKGGNFTARFEVQNPAKQPPPGPGSPIPDPTLQYSGSGSFATTNAKLRGN